MTQRELYRQAKMQLAVDLNCTPEDFDKEGVHLFPAADLAGRRPFPRKGPAFDMITFGHGTVISADERLLPKLRRLKALERDEIWSQPFLKSLGHYYLPDPCYLVETPLPEGIRLSWVEESGMKALYGLSGFDNAIGNERNDLRPDMLALCAMEGETVVAMAGVSADCAMLWQVGVDVLPAWRGKGLGTGLVSRLTRRVLQMGKVPYYGTSSGNIPSQRTAFRAGYHPAWVCSYGVDLDRV